MATAQLTRLRHPPTEIGFEACESKWMTPHRQRCESFSSQHSVHVVPLPHHQLKDTDVRVTKMTSSTSKMTP